MHVNHGDIGTQIDGDKMLFELYTMVYNVFLPLVNAIVYKQIAQGSSKLWREFL